VGGIAIEGRGAQHPGALGMNHMTYRAVIVGLGFIGGADQVSGDAIGGQQVSSLNGTHISGLKSHAEVEVVAGSSRDAGRRERFEGRNPGIKTYESWREMLRAERADIVSVATYADTHREITEAAVAAGAKAIFCEKPIAQTLADAEAMVRVCEDAGVLLMVNHTRRFIPNYQRLAEHIASGALGELVSGATRWGAGRLGNIGTHMFDSLRMISSQRIVAVSGTLDTAGRPDCRGETFEDPGGWGVLRFETGLMVTVDAADYGWRESCLMVAGTKGRVMCGRDEIHLEYVGGKKETWPSDRQIATSADHAVRQIVGWLEGNKDGCTHRAQESVDVLEVIAAFHVSHARNGAWVALPLEGKDRETPVRSG